MNRYIIDLEFTHYLLFYLMRSLLRSTDSANASVSVDEPCTPGVADRHLTGVGLSVDIPRYDCDHLPSRADGHASLRL